MIDRLIDRFMDYALYHKWAQVIVMFIMTAVVCLFMYCLLSLFFVIVGG